MKPSWKVYLWAKPLTRLSKMSCYSKTNQKSNTSVSDRFVLTSKLILVSMFHHPLKISKADSAIFVTINISENWINISGNWNQIYPHHNTFHISLKVYSYHSIQKELFQQSNVSLWVELTFPVGLACNNFARNNAICYDKPESMINYYCIKTSNLTLTGYTFKADAYSILSIKKLEQILRHKL